MNEGFGKDFHRKGNSVKRHSVNRWTLKTEKLLFSSPSRKSALMYGGGGRLGAKRGFVRGADYLSLRGPTCIPRKAL